MPRESYYSKLDKRLTKIELTIEELKKDVDELKSDFKAFYEEFGIEISSTAERLTKLEEHNKLREKYINGMLTNIEKTNAANSSLNFDIKMIIGIIIGASLVVSTLTNLFFKLIVK